MTWDLAVALHSWVLQTPTPAPPASGSGSGGGSGEPYVIIALAIFTLVGTIATAFAPTLLELAKNRSKKSTDKGEADPKEQKKGDSSQTTDEAVAQASSRLTMVEELVLDLRSQRDTAQRQYNDVLDDLDEARDIIKQQAVRIAQLEGGRRRSVEYGNGYPTHSSRPWEPR